MANSRISDLPVGNLPIAAGSLVEVSVTNPTAPSGYDSRRFNVTDLSGGRVTVGDTPPASPRVGDTWFDTSTAAMLYVFYDGFWIPAVNDPGPQGVGIAVSDTPPTSPKVGDVWFDTKTASMLYVFYDEFWISVVNTPGPRGLPGTQGIQGAPGVPLPPGGTPNTPLFDSGAGSFVNGTRSGTTTIVGTVSGAKVSGHAVAWDVNGNLVDSGVLPGSITGVIEPVTLPTGPSVHLDFTTGRYHVGPYNAPNPITVTRATVGYIDDTSGVWTAVAPNTLRRSNKGLLIEDTRTNVIKNNSMQGAVPGTPGTVPTGWSPATAGLSRQVVGIGIQNGIEYLEFRYFGTTTSSAFTIDTDSYNAIPGILGQTWANSHFLAVVAGSVAPMLNISLRTYEYDAGGVILSAPVGTDVKNLLTATLQRFSYIHTAANAAIAFIRPRFVFSANIGTTVDITVRVGWPQMELGNFVTSPIRTINAAVTRAADIVSVPLNTFGSKYGLVVSGTPNAGLTFANDQYAAAISDGTTTNRFGVLRQQTNGIPGYAIGTTKAGITGAAWAQNAASTVAAGYANADQVASFGGINTVTGANAATITGMSRLEIGSDGTGANQFNGYITRVMLYPTRRPPNAAITTLSETSGAHEPAFGYLQTPPAIGQATPANPTGTNSLTGVMMGLGTTITPSKSGTMLIVVSGTIANDTANNGAQVQLRYGTGTAPANGAALTGTAIGGAPRHTSNGTGVSPFTVNAVASLVTGTTYWIGLALNAITGGIASVSDLSVSAIEL